MKRRKSDERVMERGERMRDYVVTDGIFYSSSDEAHMCSVQGPFLTRHPHSDLRFPTDDNVLMIVVDNTFIFSYCIPSCLSAFPSSPQRDVNTIMDIDDKL